MRSARQERWLREQIARALDVTEERCSEGRYADLYALAWLCSAAAGVGDEATKWLESTRNRLEKLRARTGSVT